MDITWRPGMDAIQESFVLPAENAWVQEPDLQGVTTSGLSFKMARGRRGAPPKVEPEESEGRRR